MSANFSNEFERVHTDDFIDLGWSECSAKVAELMRRPGPWIVEGVAAVRALRKVLVYPEKPCERVIYIDNLEPETRHVSISKGCRKIFDEIRPSLRARGVTIEYRHRGIDDQSRQDR